MTHAGQLALLRRLRARRCRPRISSWRASTAIGWAGQAQPVSPDAEWPEAAGPAALNPVQSANVSAWQRVWLPWPGPHDSGCQTCQIVAFEICISWSFG